MKEYIEKQDGGLMFEGMYIPASKSNRHFREFLDLEKRGEAKRISDSTFDVWGDVKRKRNNELTASDWTQVEDNHLSARQKSAWRAYRQQLRDITETFNKPENVVWPKRP